MMPNIALKVSMPISFHDDEKRGSKQEEEEEDERKRGRWRAKVRMKACVKG